MPKALSRTERINIRVTPVQKRMLEDQAKKEGMTLTKYLVNLGINNAIDKAK